MLKRLRTLIWAVVLLGGALLAIRTFVGDIYRISSSSMAPVCLVDEFVFVLHDRSAPQRHDLVVVRHGGEVLVKRAIGVGGALGESVRIDKGDLRVNGDKLGPLEPRPPMVPLFDDQVLKIEDHFRSSELWKRDTDSPTESAPFVLDAREVPFGANAGLLGYVRSLHDGWLMPGGEVIEGIYDVADVAVEAEVVIRQSGGRLRAVLLEERDTFEFIVDFQEGGLCRVTLVRDGMSDDTGVLAEAEVPFEVGVPVQLRFVNRDDHLTGYWRLGGGTLGEWSEADVAIRASYERNAIERNPTRSPSAFERVQFGAEGCELELRRLRILRDQHWTAQGSHGVDRPVELQPGELFILGDNSHASRDGRHFGALPGEQVMGRPLMVVWPPSRAREVR